MVYICNAIRLVMGPYLMHHLPSRELCHNRSYAELIEPTAFHIEPNQVGWNVFAGVCNPVHTCTFNCLYTRMFPCVIINDDDDNDDELNNSTHRCDRSMPDCSSWLAVGLCSNSSVNILLVNVVNWSL